MNVLHVNTYTEGGAALAGLRLHTGLINAGVKSDYLALYKAKCKMQNVHDFRNSLSAFEKIKCKFNNRVRKIKYNKKFNNATELFCELESDWKLENHLLYKHADVIHLHWIDTFVNLSGFLKINKKPIVWTVHDHFPFSGGFHYPQNTINEEWEKIINRQFKSLKELLTNQTIHFICPSKQLNELAEQSGLINRFSISVIQNAIDTDIFKPKNSLSSKKIIGLNTEEKYFLFISDYLHSYRKGFHLLKSALEKHDENLNLVVVGHGKIKILNPKINVISLGHIKNEQTLATLYNSCEALINPSLEDISSNTVLEAGCCGIPSLVFNTGGIPELVLPETGIILNDRNENSLQNGIKQMQNIRFDKNKISEIFSIKNSTKNIAKQYIQKYDEVLKKSFLNK